MKKCLVASLVALMVGCTTLDSNSDFSDVVAQVETKQNYYLVEGKFLSPEAEVSRGAQLTQSTLALNYVIPHREVKVPSSYFTMEVKFFKNYGEYRYAELGGKKVPLKSIAPTAETCSDICTQRQFFKFDVSNAELDKGAEQGLRFAIASSDQNKVFFEVPAGYIKAVMIGAPDSPAPAPLAIAPAVTTAAVVASAPAEATPSKPQEMAMYWYDQLSAEQQENVTNWAVSNRKNANAQLETTEQAEQMFSYWFNKASESEKKAIIVELISQ